MFHPKVFVVAVKGWRLRRCDSGPGPGIPISSAVASPGEDSRVGFQTMPNPAVFT